MSEFSATPEDRVAPVMTAPPLPSAGASVWKRPVIAGLPWPGVIGVVLILVLTGWYLFAPDSPPTVNQLAFREDLDEQPFTTGAPSTIPLTPTASASGVGQLKDEVAAMISGVRSYAETNRTAIERLSQTVNAQGTALTALQQQLAEAQAQNSLLSGRVSFQEGRSVAVAPTQQPTQRVIEPVARTRSPLAGMRLEAVQNGMAWVYWQDKTWAVKVGDQVGLATVTRIDALGREVHTSAGTLR